MPMLGDILGQARRQAASIEAWLEEHDGSLLARTRSAADAEGTSIAAFIQASFAQYDQFASEEDWGTLISKLRDGESPGTTCLLAILDWRFKKLDGKGAM